MSGDPQSENYKFCYSWQEFYLETLVETNPRQRSLKLKLAEEAIANRLNTSGPDDQEHEALKDALGTLRFLVREQRMKQKSGVETKDCSA
jgi:hypothetical protein